MTTQTDSTTLKQAVINAINFVKELYEDQQTQDLLLEEVEFSNEHNQWLVTVGFSVPQKDGFSSIISPSKPLLARHYKVIRIDAESGDVLSMKMRKV